MYKIVGMNDGDLWFGYDVKDISNEANVLNYIKIDKIVRVQVHEHEYSFSLTVIGIDEKVIVKLSDKDEMNKTYLELMHRIQFLHYSKSEAGCAHTQ